MHVMLCYNLRFGAGKLSLESKIIEEVSYFNDAVRNENGKAFDIKVSIHI